MTKAGFTDSLIGFTNLATAAGLADTEQAFALLLVALGIGDKKTPGGLTREQFISMAGLVYDKSRKALAAGVPS